MTFNCIVSQIAITGIREYFESFQIKNFLTLLIVTPINELK